MPNSRAHCFFRIRHRPRPRILAALSVIFSNAGFVFAQTNHNITVGAVGSFFDPPTVSAAINDTVTFIFLGPAHSVIQADVWNPCVPASGGFSSGIVQRVNESAPRPTWTIRVMNVSEGIWFYCGNPIPVSHCAAGMVGAINPPSIASYNEYLAAAKQVTASPAPVPFSLIGNGASAESPPGPPTPTSVSSLTDTSSTSSSPPPSSSTSSSSTPPPTSTPASSTPARPTIIGASVGGGIIFIILALLVCLVLRRRRSARRERPGSKDFFRYKAQTPTLPSSNVEFSSARLVAAPADRVRLLQQSGGVSAGTNMNMSTAAESTPVYLPIPLTPQRMGQVPSGNGTSASASASRHSTSETGTRAGRGMLGRFPSPPVLGDRKGSRTSVVEREPPNIQVLAREVAAVLMRDPQVGRGQHGSGGGGGGEGGSGSGSRDESGVGMVDRVESPAPPKYTRMSVI